METSDALLQQRYRLLRPLGEGAQARTYLARDTQSKEEVVIKTLSVGHAADWKSIELFEREATVLKSLDHPAIPSYIDAFYIEDIGFCLVQEYLQGDSVQACWEDCGEVFDEKKIRGLLDDILSILVYLQSFSPPIIHRDIKPSNMLVSSNPDGLFCLIDFGAVQRIAHGGVGGSTVVGTSGYMPPEQLMGRAQSATDLYALAATCVYLASGIEPSQLPVKRMRLQFREYVDLSARLSSILEKMLEPDIDDRFASAQEVLDALHAPGWASLPRDASQSKALASREVALQERIAHPPMMAPASRAELSDGRLRIELPIRVEFPVAKMFAGIGIIVLGLFMMSGGLGVLSWLGLFMPLLGTYFFVSSLTKFSGEGQDGLCISAKGVEFERVKWSAKQKRWIPKENLFMPLNSLNNCYLEDSKGSRKSGIVFRGATGRRLLFGGRNILVHRDPANQDGEPSASAEQKGLGDQESRWLFEIIQAHLQALNDYELPVKAVESASVEDIEPLKNELESP